MQQQANLDTRSSQVIEQLLSIGFADRRRRFDFKNDSTFDEKVSPEVPDYFLIIPDVNGHFAFKGHSGFHKFPCQRISVNGLQKAKAHAVVDAIEGATSDIRDIAVQVSRISVLQCPFSVHQCSAVY